MSPISGLASLGALSQSPAGQKVIDAISGPLGTLTSSLSGLLSGKTDVTEVPNSATEGQPGYGWKYFSDGTSIDPEGNYYRGNEKIWSPAPGNTSDTGTSNSTTDPGFGYTGDPIVDNAMTNTERKMPLAGNLCLPQSICRCEERIKRNDFIAVTVHQ